MRDPRADPVSASAANPETDGPAATTLAGRVVAVIGATGGLGRATALACGAAGATVVLIGRRVRALEQVYDELVAVGAPQPAIRPLDLATAGVEECEEAAAAIGAGLGRLDAVVFAVADFEHLARTAATDPSIWLRQLHVNLAAPWLLFRAFEPLLAMAPVADAVFVLDDPARMRRAYWGGYGTAKAGLEGLAAALAHEYEHSVIRVREFSPGPMRTGLRGKAFAGEPDGDPPGPERAAAAILGFLTEPRQRVQAHPN